MFEILKEKGIKVPDEVAVVGFDDIDACIHVEPRLTPVRVDKEELGVVAVKHLVEMIRKPNSGINRVYLPVKLNFHLSCYRRKHRNLFSWLRKNPLQPI